jgi:hypothetical protein
MYPCIHCFRMCENVWLYLSLQYDTRYNFYEIGTPLQVNISNYIGACRFFARLQPLNKQLYRATAN